MDEPTDDRLLRSLEDAFREPDITDEMLDAWNAFDNHRFGKRVQELVDAHPRAAVLNRQKHVAENQPLDVPSTGEIAYLPPRGLSLRDWSISGRHEDPVEIYVRDEPPTELIHVGPIRREEVRRVQG